MKLNANSGWVFFASFGLYLLLSRFVPNEFDGPLFIFFVFVAPSLIKRFLNNPKNEDIKNRVESVFSSKEEQASKASPENLVECPYCSHMNPDDLTFCEKCNGLL
jgi:hypothetical protein